MQSDRNAYLDNLISLSIREGESHLLPAKPHASQAVPLPERAQCQSNVFGYASHLPTLDSPYLLSEAQRGPSYTAALFASRYTISQDTVWSPSQYQWL